MGEEVPSIANAIVGDVNTIVKPYIDGDVSSDEEEILPDSPERLGYRARGPADNKSKGQVQKDSTIKDGKGPPSGKGPANGVKVPPKDDKKGKVDASKSKDPKQKDKT
ncbi:hypothetical protein BDQ12DRAFT_689657 [Crucibulum laeve]|uniref:Uncharacterized protein n=1 Tax=Crucibulum laeve TaxID=68775 RepID=A0A5C3LMR9_9AGAR|nr:hypothetical protein BDQ12DRAFT_689657 [Crucibulum laeve]